MKLHEAYPSLNLIVQDKEAVIQQALSVWETRYPSAISEDKVKLSAHDFFKTNAVQGAEVYWLRHVM